MQRKEKLNICRIVFEFAPYIGGSVVHTIELSNNIHPYLNRQILIVPKADVDTTALDKSFPFEVHRVRYCRFKALHWIKARLCRWLYLAPLVLFTYQLSAIVEIFRINRKYGIDIIHAHGIGTGPAATIAGRLLRKPVVWMMHGTTEAYSKASGRYETIMTKLFKPDHTIVLDQGSIAPQKFKKLLDGNVTAVYHGIDSSKFYPKIPDKELMNDLGLQNNDFVAISVHSLIPVYNVGYAISAFGEFVKMCGAFSAILLIVGDGNQRKQLEDMAHKLGITSSVLFLGVIANSQIPDYLAISNVALCTSLYTNLNRSLQEAMACGKPVMAFNAGGSNKAINHMETGLLAENGNIQDLAEKMLLLYQNPGLRKKLGDNARNFIVEHRSWEGRLKTELAIYEKLLQCR